MPFPCRLTPADLQAAQWLHLRPKPWVFYLGVALVIGAGIAILFSSQSPEALATTLSLIVPVAIWALVFFLFLWLLTPWQMKRLFRQQKMLQVDFTTDITPEAIIVTSEYGTSRLPWADFHKYKVSSKLVLLYQSPVLYHVLPRRFFPSEEDYQTLLGYLRQHLGPPTRFI